MTSGTPPPAYAPLPPPTTSFTASRLNPTTFLIVEHDSYGELPHIYAKLHPTEKVLILSDTGCNSPRDSSKEITHLRQFIEEYPLPANNNVPLNPPGPNQRSYVIICSHCHYDHIGGISQFASLDGTTIVASAVGKDFIEHDLPKHSLCADLGIPTPKYTVTQWAKDGEGLCWTRPGAALSAERGEASLGFQRNTNHSSQPVDKQRPIDLHITLLQTPGHTPDSLAWYDIQDRHLFVGDTLYELGPERMPILFTGDGNWIDYMATLHHLLTFVRLENEQTVEEEEAEVELDSGVEKEEEGKERLDGEEWTLLTPRPRVRLGCAHQTPDVDAEAILLDVIQLFERIIAGKVPVVERAQKRGEVFCLWREDEGKGSDGGEVRFAVGAPERLVCEVRREREGGGGKSGEGRGREVVEAVVM